MGPGLRGRLRRGPAPGRGGACREAPCLSGRLGHCWRRGRGQLVSGLVPHETAGWGWKQEGVCCDDGQGQSPGLGRVSLAVGVSHPCCALLSGGWRGWGYRMTEGLGGHYVGLSLRASEASCLPVSVSLGCSPAPVPGSPSLTQSLSEADWGSKLHLSLGAWEWIDYNSEQFSKALFQGSSTLQNY